MMKSVFFYATIALVIFSSCSSSQKKETRIAFKYNEMGAVTSLDPAYASSFENIRVVGQLYNGLVSLSDSLSIQPDLAKSWEISSDGLTYTFHLRGNVYFHANKCFEGAKDKGRLATATDFVYTFNRLKDPRTSGATSLLSCVQEKNAFEATNDTTFVIHLRQSFTPFLGILATRFFSVIPHEAVELYGEDFRRNPVGTGPFQFKLWEEGAKLILLKNPNYFEMENGIRLPYLDAVSISFTKDRETSFLNFLKGDLDMVSGLDAINTDQVLTTDGKLKAEYKNSMVLQTQPFLKTDYLGFFIDEKFPSVQQSPLKLKAIRQAINYGFDRKKMVAYLRRNLGQAANSGFVPPGLPSYDSLKVKGYDYDPDQVKKLLKQAGYPGGEGLPEITLATAEQYQDLAEYIQAQLGDLGIKIKIDVQKASVLNQSIADSKVNFFRKSWIADYADAENFLSLFYSKNWNPAGFNFTHYSNPKYDQLFEKAREELNPEKRYAYYQEMDQLLINDAPIVPLYYDQVVWLVHTNIQGLRSNPMNILTLKKVKKIKS
ncbi:MAG TPA: ABC transporter substrate-binding protein [Bacteroidia bacterium]|nr:ABC transporter substrate-binding protein [Bacteroidia bacterium]